MAIFDLFSKRQKVLRGEVPDVYTYDSLPNSLRVQIIHIWSDVLGNEDDYHQRLYGESAVELAYGFIVKALCREYGLFELSSNDSDIDRMYLDELTNYLMQEDDVEKQLDVIELSFGCIDSITRNRSYLKRDDANKLADAAINELNNRFKEHGVGYEFVENQIIRIDSEFLHAEAVKPALRLLNEKIYHGARQEFLSAHEHYRYKRNKESLNECLKSFESTMEAICDKHQWAYQPNVTAKSLIKICFDNHLVPLFWEQQFTTLRSMLESGIPTGRNKLSGHGQGSTPEPVPDYLVPYMLHMTATTIVFLATAEKEI